MLNYGNIHVDRVLNQIMPIKLRNPNSCSLVWSVICHSGPDTVERARRRGQEWTKERWKGTIANNRKTEWLSVQGCRENEMGLGVMVCRLISMSRSWERAEAYLRNVRGRSSLLWLTWRQRLQLERHTHTDTCRPLNSVRSETHFKNLKQL